MSGNRAARRPPTNTKLQRILCELEAKREDIHATMPLRETLRKLYVKGLPSGLDPAVVAAVIFARMPQGYEIERLVRRTGTEYDEALVTGVRRFLERFDVLYVLDVALVAALTEHGGVSWATAYEHLRQAEEQVGRDPSTNLPSDLDPAVLERISAAMDPWFSPRVVAHTLSLAHEGMGPLAWSIGEERGATAPQCDEEWALFIGCALHPSEAVREVLAVRCERIALLDEPGRSAVCEVLAYARRKHGERVPAPPL